MIYQFIGTIICLFYWFYNPSPLSYPRYIRNNIHKKLHPNTTVILEHTTPGIIRGLPLTDFADARFLTFMPAMSPMAPSTAGNKKMIIATVWDTEAGDREKENCQIKSNSTRDSTPTPKAVMTAWLTFGFMTANL